MSTTPPAQVAPLVLARFEQVADTIAHEAGKLAAVLSDDSRMVCSLREQAAEVRSLLHLLKRGAP